MPHRRAARKLRHGFAGRLREHRYQAPIAKMMISHIMSLTKDRPRCFALNFYDTLLSGLAQSSALGRGRLLGASLTGPYSSAMLHPSGTEETILKGITVALFISVTILTAGCDAWITIHQLAPSNQDPRLTAAPSPAIAIAVEPQQPHAQFTDYQTHLRVINRLDTPISVSRVELITRKATYSDKAARSEDYPLPLPPKQTRTIVVRFKLKHDVRKTFFEKPAELRVYYVIGAKEEFASAPLLAGRWAGRAQTT